MKPLMISAALIAMIEAAPAAGATLPFEAGSPNETAVQSASAELVQYYGSPYYGPSPYREWQREEYWRERRAEERRAYWEARRRAGWLCEHGDSGSCRWLQEHS